MAAAIATDRIAGRVVTKEFSFLSGQVRCLYIGNVDTYDKASSANHIVGYWSA